MGQCCNRREDPQKKGRVFVVVSLTWHIYVPAFTSAALHNEEKAEWAGEHISVPAGTASSPDSES